MSDEARDLLVRGIAAAKDKDKSTARFYLEWVLRIDADTEQQARAWLWLSEISDDPASKCEYLENVLVLEPGNALARRGLAILNGQLDPAEIVDPDRLPQAAAGPESPQPARTKQFICQKCGGKMAFTPDRQTLTCAYCDRRVSLYKAIEEGAMVEEQNFVIALATAKGHTHPMAMQSFDCHRCGASFLRGPDVLSLTCPYCASVYVVEAPQTREVIPPQGIIPFAVPQEEAARALRQWIEKKRLRTEARMIAPPAGLYLPAWTFDAGGVVRWQRVVTEYQRERMRGPEVKTVNGGQPIFYDDVLVPASRTLPADLAKVVQSFSLAALVPYEPGYLADWPAEVYQIAVSDASLVARQQVWQQVRQSAGADPFLGMSAQATFNSSGIVVESFKLVLLPVWIARYRYRGTEYTAVINGQTGNVRGQVPRSGFGRWLATILGNA